MVNGITGGVAGLGRLREQLGGAVTRAKQAQIQPPGTAVSIIEETQARGQRQQQSEIDRLLSQIGLSTSLREVGITADDVLLLRKSFEALGFSPLEATRLAVSDVQDVGRQLITQQEARGERAAFAERFPELQRAAVGELGEALTASSARFLQETLQPQIERQLASRGLLESGALNVELGRAAERLGQRREEQLAPLLTQATVGAGQLQFQELARQAQEAGIDLQTPSIFFQQAFQPLAQQQQQRFQAGQADIQREFQERLQREQIERQQQASLGGLGGVLLSTLLGGGLGAILPGVTAGAGALAGLTGLSPTSFGQQQPRLF